MLEYIADRECQIFKGLAKCYPQVSFGQFNKALRKKDVKVNGKRVGDNIVVSAGDKVQVYIQLQPKDIDVVYSDERIVVVDKPYDLEVECDGECAKSILREKLGREVYPCHRIDRNTTGLVIFAYTEQDSYVINDLLSSGKIKKYYLALVFGTPQKVATLRGYLFKDSKASQVYIEDKKTASNKSITTNYRKLESAGEISMLLVDIPTGRTHQIRAHLASVGLPVVGDNKYGDVSKNKKYHRNRQQLQAYKLVFGDIDGDLKYLSGLEIEVKNKLSIEDNKKMM